MFEVGDEVRILPEGDRYDNLIGKVLDTELEHSCLVYVYETEKEIFIANEGLIVINDFIKNISEEYTI